MYPSLDIFCGRCLPRTIVQKQFIHKGLKIEILKYINKAQIAVNEAEI